MLFFEILARNYGPGPYKVLAYFICLCAVTSTCLSAVIGRYLGHKKRKYVSDTFGKKAKCYAIFYLFFNSENELSPMRFFSSFSYSQGSMFMYFVIFKTETLK